MLYYLLGVNCAVHQELASLSVGLVSAISSPLCHWKVSGCEIYVLQFSGSQLINASFRTILRFHLSKKGIESYEVKSMFN